MTPSVKKKAKGGSGLCHCPYAPSASLLPCKALKGLQKTLRRDPQVSLVNSVQLKSKRAVRLVPRWSVAVLAYMTPLLQSGSNGFVTNDPHYHSRHQSNTSESTLNDLRGLNFFTSNSTGKLGA
jgi:hypothetical protein